MGDKKFVGTPELAEATGMSRSTAWRACVENPGFAFKLRDGGRFSIPWDHIERVRRGESPAEIAAKARGRRAA